MPDCSAHRAALHIQVLPVSAEEIAELTADAGCRASPLLCLSQDSLVDFLRPVRIQLPLPFGVTGQFIPKTGKEKLCVEKSKWQAIVDGNRTVSLCCWRSAHSQFKAAYSARIS